MSQETFDDLFDEELAKNNELRVSLDPHNISVNKDPFEDYLCDIGYTKSEEENNDDVNISEEESLEMNMYDSDLITA